MTTAPPARHAPATDGLPALILAGHRPDSKDPNAASGFAGPKALLDVAGRPLVSWVIDALRGSPRVGAITLVGLQTVANGASLVDNLLAGVRAVRAHHPHASHLLATGADAPLLTPDAVTWFVDACSPRSADVYVALVARPTIEAHYPGSRRTYLPTRAGPFCSGDMILARPQVLLDNESLLREIVAARKEPLRLVHRAGVRWLLRLLLGRLHPDDLRPAAERIAGAQLRPVILPFAGPAMDVDKPQQLEWARTVLAPRADADNHIQTGASSTAPESNHPC